MKDLDDLKALYEAGTQGLLFIHDFRGASDKPSVHDITISCDHPATITVAYMGNALTATPEEALANAKKFVALHNKEPALFAAVEALKGLSDMYSHAWDLVNGGLCMMEGSVPKFEAAHKKAFDALAALKQLG